MQEYHDGMDPVNRKCVPCEGVVPELNEEKLKIELWTHAIPGPSENDFIPAAKIDSL